MRRFVVAALLVLGPQGSYRAGGQQPAVVKHQPQLVAQLGHSSVVNSVSLSGDGKWPVTASLDETARLWEVAQGREVRAFRGHANVVSSVCLSGDGKWLATGSWDKTARLWEAASGKEVRAFRGHTN